MMMRRWVVLSFIDDSVCDTPQFDGMRSDLVVHEETNEIQAKIT